MTPKHQALIDTVLHRVHHRSVLIQRALRHAGETHQQDAEPRDALVERLRGSVLGQRLRRIAEYVEGYPAAVEPTHRTVGFGLQEREIVEGGMRREVYLVCQVVYGVISEEHLWKYPKQCHRTELGKLFHAALWQFYREHLPAEQLVTVMEATKRLGIGRQTVHTWMAEGTLHWISDAEHDRIWLDSDEVRRIGRQRRGQGKGEEEEL